MTTLAQLFPHFDDLIQTPADVQRLNEAILQLAVQGKLVPQDPADEPASVLLERNGANRKLISDKKAPAAGDDEMPFPIPIGWEWTRTSDICHSINDGDHQPPPKSESGVPFLVISNIRSGKLNFSDTRYVPEDYYDTIQEVRKPRKWDILYSIVGSLGTSVLIEEDIKFCFQRHMALFRPSEAVIPQFLYYVLQSPLVLKQARASATGIAQLTIPMAGLRKLLVPLPPLAEQKRIVAKVDELLAQTRALEAKLRRAAESIVVVNRAVLHRVQSAPDPAAFQHAWATLRDHFDDLTTDPRTLTDLRQTILQLAVQGRLVPQDPHDEPASALLKRIEAKKERLVEVGKLGKEKSLFPITEDEVLFELPTGWEWARLADVILAVQTGPFGSALHKSDYVENGIPVVNPANIQEDCIRILPDMMVSDNTLKRLSRYILEQGDIVMGRRGEMGRCALVTEREAGWLCGSGSFVLKTSSEVFKPFLIMMIRSPHSRAYLAGGSVGATMNNLNHRILNNMVVALPPLAEQQRIVAKVDELLARCDALAAKLGAAQVAGGQLTAALLAQAVGL